jgi:uncharacterized protein (TIGR02231 family)
MARRRSIHALPPLAGLVLALIAPGGPVFGAEITAASAITAVTVFPSGAEIVRSADVDLVAGEHNVIILVPGELQRQQLRVGATAKDVLSIRSVDVRVLPPKPAEADPARQEIERQIERLADERTALDQAIADAELSREIIVSLAGRRLQPQGKEAPPAVPPPAELSALLDLVGGRIAQISKANLDARQRQREIGREIDELQRRLADMTPHSGKQSQVSINVVASKPAQTTLRVSYLLSAASWHPVYDARLDTGENGQPRRLVLVRNAEVTQATDEPWPNVQLALSTARPTGATRAPQVEAQEIHSHAELRLFQKMQVGGQSATGPTSIEMPAEANEAVAGFHAFYEIPGPATVDNSNTPKLVIIGSEEMAADLSLRAVPRIDLTAYLLVHSKLAGPTALLPGKVMLYRDGSFTGEGTLPRLSPGETFEIGFGADDYVIIERRELSHRAGETGLISSAIVDERSFLTTISNRRAMAIPITILDQVPYAADNRIRVELLPDTDPPTSKDVDRQQGVYAWTRTLEPDSRTELRFGFRVIWPKDMRW